MSIPAAVFFAKGISGCGSASFAVSYPFSPTVHVLPMNDPPEDFDIDSIDFKNVTGESEETCADPTEIKKLGWEHKYSLDDGLHLTYEWYRDFKKK